MSRLLIILSFLFYSALLHGQQSKDTLLSDRLVLSAEEKVGKNPTEAIKEFRQASELFNVQKNAEGMARTFKGIGKAYYYLGRYDSTLFYWDKSMQSLQLVGGTSLADSYNNMGIIFQRLGEVDSSALYHRKSFDLRKELKDTIGVAHSSFNLAALDRQQGEFRTALENYILALRIYELLDNQIKVGETYNSIGLVYNDLRQDSAALDYLERALLIKQQNQLEHSAAKTMNNMASVYMNSEDFEQAEQYYRKAQEIFEKYRDVRMIAAVALNLGNIYKNRNDLISAKESYLQAAASFERLRDPEGMASAYTNLGSIILKEKNYGEAEEYYKKAYENANLINSVPIQIKVAHGLSDIYREKGDYESAFRYESIRVELNDSIFSKTVAEEIAELQEKYESEKKSREIQELKVQTYQQEREGERQRYWIWGISVVGVAGLLILSLLVARHRLKRRLSEKEKERYRLRVELKQTELDSRNRELTVYAGNVLQKNHFIQELKDELEDALAKVEIADDSASKINSLLRNASSTDDDWEKFKKHFEDVHPEFFQKLRANYPQLTVNDLKQSAYLKMNLSSKEIAILMNISPKSVKMNRYRLKKKLDLDAEEDLQQFLSSF